MNLKNIYLELSENGYYKKRIGINLGYYLQFDMADRDYLIAYILDGKNEFAMAEGMCNSYDDFEAICSELYDEMEDKISDIEHDFNFLVRQ